MIVALIDNGSLEPAAHRNLRAAAAALAARSGRAVHAVSWRHSDRIPAAALDGSAAATLIPWMRSCLAQGEREFLFVPFFVSPQGAIGSSLRRDLDELLGGGAGFDYGFTRGLADSHGAPILTRIVVDRVREAVARGNLRRPAVIVVDHGGPSSASVRIRDAVAAGARESLGDEIARLSAASLESAVPLLEERLADGGFSSGDVVIAPLFLAPGRHAGQDGDLARAARAAEIRAPGLRCHFCELVGTHTLAIDALADALVESLQLPASP